MYSSSAPLSTSLRRTLSISTGSSPTVPIIISSEPPRKRPRITTQLEMERTESSKSESSTLMGDPENRDWSYEASFDVEATRDELYYRPDADCVVRVGSALFKVHKFLLARDASAFQDMFSMPSDAEPDNTAGPLREGGSDANPIVLYGETEDEFRILLSALYAMPSELQQYSSARCDVSRLLIIAYLTNKYHFASTSQWAISSLYHVLAQYSSPPLNASGSPTASPTSPTRIPAFGWDVERLPEEYDLNTCSPDLLVRIMDVSMVCGHDELSGLVETRWVERLWGTPPSTPGDYNTHATRKTSYSRADEAKWAVSVADRWSMKRLRGVAYYVCLMEMGEELSRVAQGEADAPVSADDTASVVSLAMHNTVASTSSHLYQAAGAGPPPPLTPLQTTRLLLGHLSLAHLWDTQLHVHAPVIPPPMPGSCTYHQQGCIFTWTSAWRDAARSPLTLKCKTSDVMGRVRSMEKQLLASDELIVALTPGCRRRALCAVREKVKGLEDSLGEHFRGVIGGEL
ncbi:hypothetical protein EIP91_004628 [Steccherinum ochraceum]|uniref:BTB domain-containing protein n=1 Tax=Steccherinum ochraceum TaxID=92696 RepID=A0A4R0RZU9_9APHY|nr:hypothetical protein EIP91_004628 [Steccherinum ochraceum]